MFIGLPKQRVRGTNFQFPEKKFCAENDQVITDKGGGGQVLQKYMLNSPSSSLVKQVGTLLIARFFSANLFCNSYFNIVVL